MPQDSPRWPWTPLGTPGDPQKPKFEDVSGGRFVAALGGSIRNSNFSTNKTDESKYSRELVESILWNTCLEPIRSADVFAL